MGIYLTGCRAITDDHLRRPSVRLTSTEIEPEHPRPVRPGNNIEARDPANKTKTAAELPGSVKTFEKKKLKPQPESTM